MLKINNKKIRRKKQNPINNISITTLVVLLFLLLTYIYYVVSREYSYSLSNYGLSFNLGRFILSATLLIATLIMYQKIKEELLKFIFMSVFILLFLGESICFIFNNDSNAISLVGSFMVLLFLLLFQNTKIKFKNNIIRKNPMPILLIISILLFIPFVIQYYDKINIKNLFLIDIYDTRMEFREYSNQLLGYITAPLSRIILPSLLAIAIKNKKKNYIIICSLMILFMFLCGALKSILFGLIAVIIMYKGTYEEKIKRLLLFLTGTCIIGIIIYLLFGNIEIVNIIRRVFYVPPRLNSMYANYFSDKPTFLSHSPLGLGLEENIYGSSISRYFGEKVLGANGLNANVGIITEGFISFNIIGTILFSLFASLILLYLKWIEIDEIFAGIIIVYVYYINTSFLSTLLLTHGLLFLIIFSFFFMRKRTNHE